MTSKEYLNVHELASLFGLNVQTLHYYDKVGVFKPSDRDPGNRYRKYRFDQIMSWLRSVICVSLDIRWGQSVNFRIRENLMYR